VQLFYPDPAWAVAGTNPRRRIKTGSVQEYWVLAGFTALLVFSLWVAEGGGLTEKVTQSLGIKSGVVNTYNQNAGTNHVYAVVEGVWSSDRSKADGEYFILDTLQGEFLVTDGESIYQTNFHLIPTKMTSRIGEKAVTLNQSLVFNDSEAVSSLTQLKQTYPNADIYLSGLITVDFPEDITPDFPSNKIATLTKTENRITLNYHPIDKGITDLQDQFVIGTINAKIINPRPERFNN
jgi:inner membrane protein